MRVPLLVAVPGKPRAAGAATSALFELIDVFPTIAALTGLPAPAGVDGADLSRLWDDPSATPKEVAWHQARTGPSLRFTLYTLYILYFILFTLYPRRAGGR